MQKVVIFENGNDGERFADYLEQELAVVDVIRVSAPKPKLPDPKTMQTRTAVADAALSPYIGRAEVIVLASYEATLATSRFLHHKYPEQKLVGFWPQLSRHLKKVPDGKRVMLLARDEVRHSPDYQKEVRRLDRFEVVESNCDDWMRAITDADFGKEFIPKEKQRTGTVDIVLLYCDSIEGIQEAFERVYGWQVNVLDDYKGVFRETCTALGFRGKDGGRGRF